VLLSTLCIGHATINLIWFYRVVLAVVRKVTRPAASANTTTKPKAA
jgi:hypothetical protein